MTEEILIKIFFLKLEMKK